MQIEWYNILLEVLVCLLLPAQSWSSRDVICRGGWGWSWSREKAAALCSRYLLLGTKDPAPMQRRCFSGRPAPVLLGTQDGGTKAHACSEEALGALVWAGFFEITFGWQ